MACVWTIMNWWYKNAILISGSLWGESISRRAIALTKGTQIFDAFFIFSLD